MPSLASPSSTCPQRRWLRTRYMGDNGLVRE